LNKILLGVIAVLLLPAAAFAVDGQILINQATVMAAGGFPYKITQPGSYKLSGNLSVPLGVHAIAITADGVTLDLNGFSIIGPGVFPNGSGQYAFAAVFCADHERITVTNGSVSGFVNGLLFVGNSRFIVLDKLNVNANTSMNGQPVSGGAAVVGVNVAAYSLIRDSIFLGQVQLTCPSLIRDSSVSAVETNVPPDGSGFDFPRQCTGAANIVAPFQ